MRTSIWERWSVYEYLKGQYLQSGSIPGPSELTQIFSDADAHEVQEGIAEFWSTANHLRSKRA